MSRFRTFLRHHALAVFVALLCAFVGLCLGIWQGLVELRAGSGSEFFGLRSYLSPALYVGLRAVVGAFMGFCGGVVIARFWPHQ